MLLALAVASVLALVLSSGCEKDFGKMHANRPPETGLFLEGPLDTVIYSVKLYWWGRDSDGDVVGFYYRWTCADSASTPDTNWVFTTAKSGNFILPAPKGYAVQTFWIKAVDNAGDQDPTPATLDFPISDQMPSVAFTTSTLPDTTLPAATFSWTGTDPDGDNTIAYYVLWLDGKEDSPIIVAGTDTTLGPSYIDTYGNRTVYLRAIDQAEGASPTISHTWNVIAPVGDVLLVDDVPSSVSGAATTDAFYRSLVDSLEGSGQYTIFDLGNTSRVRSAREVSYVLPLFKQVVWYGDTRSGPSAALTLGEAGIGEFLDGHGKIYLEGIALFGTGGSLSNAFAAQYLGIDSLRTRYISQGIPKSTNFDFTNGFVMRGNDSLGLDSLKVVGIYGGCEIMYPDAQAQMLFYLPPGTITGQTENYYVGTLYNNNGFSSACITFPIRRCNGFGTARLEVAKILTMLGVGQ